MEFQFTRNTLMGEFYVKCSMGHEIVARWLQEEVGKELTKIDQVLAIIDQAKQNPMEEVRLEGKEISLSIHQFDVIVEENVLGHEQELGDSEFDFYDSESTASCGLEDFLTMMEQWHQFITQGR
ncbi:YacL family protein [Vibrio maerlii]|uniref:YacL family protein n=1 Tax=Vibrio maerlii TaxID=2231648 RepID=UPI000E3E5D4F|nr:YacL family protein [Vibrio maerlii]